MILSVDEALAQLEDELNEQYASMRDEYKKKQEEILSLEEARKRKPNLFEDGK